MKHQPTPAQKGNDNVQTPPQLAARIVDHFRPRGTILEPCEGGGNFTVALARYCTTLHTMEIKRGYDFLALAPDKFPRIDWIVTNPPWSKVLPFLVHSMKLADNVVFLITLNHAMGTKARIRAVREAGFGLKEILLLDTPEKGTGWPQSGFQLAAVHWKGGWCGPIHISR